MMVPKGDPWLMITHCGCGDPECKAILVAILNPHIQEVEGTEGELAATAQLPMKDLRDTMLELKRLAHERGVDVGTI